MDPDTSKSTPRPTETPLDLGNLQVLLLSLLAGPLLTAALFQHLGLPLSFASALIGLALGLVGPRLLGFQPSKNDTLFAVVILGLSLLSGLIFDFSADGNGYHKPAVIQLLSGWNAFRSASGTGELNYWSVAYPKASWFSGAQFALLGSSLECAKAINFLAMAAAVLASRHFLAKRFPQHPRAVLAGALVLGCNPVSAYQSFSFYVDGLMASFLLILLLSLADLIRNDGGARERFSAAVALVFLINLKFTGFAFSGIIVALFLLFVARARGMRVALRAIAFWAVISLGAVLLVGKSPYVDNLLAGRHLFHPLMGPGKVDIIESIRPANLAPLNRVSRFLVATYSEPRGVRFPDSTHLTPPLVMDYVHPEKIWIDTEASGFGFFFSTAFSLATILSLVCLWRHRSAVGEAGWFILAAVLLSGFCHEEAWWARYSPQLFIPAAMAAFASLRIDGRSLRLVGYALTGILLVNLFVLSVLAIVTHVGNSGQRQRELTAMRETGRVIEVVSPCPIATSWQLREAGIQSERVDTQMGKGWRPLAGVNRAFWRPRP